jgi:hypothetical protein
VRAALLLLVAVAGPVAVSWAHELRPALLEVSERDAGRYAVVWKVPVVGDRALALEPLFPAQCSSSGSRASEVTTNARVQEWSIDCGSDGLSRGQIVIDGLERTLTDVLLRIDRRGQDPTTALLRSDAPAAMLDRKAGATAMGYLRLGLEHIVFAPEELLFVLALVLIAGRRFAVLVKTIAAFTLGQSVTLALTVLHVVRVTLAPVEAVIALSGMFVAAEIVRARAGRVGLTLRAPWVVALGFGLLHGFGSAGAVAEIGLPTEQIVLALLLFNLGSALGQLGFVTACEVVLRGESRAAPCRAGWAESIAPYAIGTMAAFWLVQRVVTF